MAMVEESARLYRSIDVESLSFDDIMGSLRSYVKTVLLTEEVGRQLGVDAELEGQFGDLLRRAEQRHDPDPEQCKADRVAGWNLQMSLPKGSKTSLMAEVVVICMYDRDSAEFDTFGPDAMIESILTSICGLGDGFCGGFVDVLIESRSGR